MSVFKKWISRNKHNYLIAVEAVLTNRIRSFLTALGIIFGVAAVIAMMAVGKGAEEEVIRQIELVGVNNIVILPKATAAEEVKGNAKMSKKFSPGLTLLDAARIEKSIPSVSQVCAQVTYQGVVQGNGKRHISEIHGVSQNYASLFNLNLKNGKNFSDEQIKQNMAVCLIGEGIAKKIFPDKKAIGNKIKCQGIWYRIIDVIESRGEASSELTDMGINSLNDQVLVPIQTLLLRYKNRILVNERKIAASYEEDDEKKAAAKGDPLDKHQLSKIVVQVAETSQMKASVEVLGRLMKRLHNDVEDFKIQVPELLLKQQQQTKNVFNIVLGAIAGISLVVGGIGIMNIMLASVMERTREIGLRQAIGARKKDVRYQFVFEALSISLAGGIIGILLGCTLAWVISFLFDIHTVVSISSILISFGVSALVGVSFGYLPAKKASEEDPANTLRYG